MKTQRASILIFLVSIIALFACVLIESRQVKNLTAFITDKTILVDEYRDYIKESFTYGISEEDQEIMDDLLRDHSNTIVIAAPTSACWACFESLIPKGHRYHHNHFSKIGSNERKSPQGKRVFEYIL